jgi:rhodanese-related sulfurtransferase
MMKSALIKLTPLFLFVLLFTLPAQGQKSLDILLKTSNKESVPYISVAELNSLLAVQDVLILDAREHEEFDVSHIASAKYVGFNDFSSEKISAAITDKNSPIVVYCSLGIRSEDIGEKLLEQGFTDVKNLYGGIFEWKNQGYTVIDSQGNETENVHAFSKFWSRWLKNGNKIY